MECAAIIIRKAQAKEHKAALKAWREQVFMEWYNCGQRRVQLFDEMERLDQAIAVVNLEIKILNEARAPK